MGRMLARRKPPAPGLEKACFAVTEPDSAGLNTIQRLQAGPDAVRQTGYVGHTGRKCGFSTAQLWADKILLLARYANGLSTVAAGRPNPGTDLFYTDMNRSPHHQEVHEDRQDGSQRPWTGARSSELVFEDFRNSPVNLTGLRDGGAAFPTIAPWLIRSASHPESPPNAVGLGAWALLPILPPLRQAYVEGARAVFGPADRGRNQAIAHSALCPRQNWGGT